MKVTGIDSPRVWIKVITAFPTWHSKCYWDCFTKGTNCSYNSFPTWHNEGYLDCFINGTNCSYSSFSDVAQWGLLPALPSLYVTISVLLSILTWLFIQISMNWSASRASYYLTGHFGALKISKFTELGQYASINKPQNASISKVLYPFYYFVPTVRLIGPLWSTYMICKFFFFQIPE